MLNFRGQSLPFGGIGGIGASTVDTDGDVFNLDDPVRFGGTYAQVRFGAVVADRRGLSGFPCTA